MLDALTAKLGPKMVRQGVLGECFLVGDDADVPHSMLVEGARGSEDRAKGTHSH